MSLKKFITSRHALGMYSIALAAREDLIQRFPEIYDLNPAKKLPDLLDKSLQKLHQSTNFQQTRQSFKAAYKNILKAEDYENAAIAYVELAMFDICSFYESDDFTIDQAIDFCKNHLLINGNSNEKVMALYRDALLYRGILYHRMNLLDKAIMYYKQAIKIAEEYQEEECITNIKSKYLAML